MTLIELRKHQVECIDNIKSHFENDNKALIKMFCGSGKSFIIYHCLLEYTNNLSVIVVPSINLITQFNKDYLLDKNKQQYNKKYFKKSFEILTVCSKNELSNNINLTTDSDKILEFIEIEGSKIILITYQSLELLINIIKENELKIDLLCFDEAHHILGNNIKELLFGIEDEDDNYIENFIDTYCNKTLFFTATPKNSNNIMMYESITNYNQYELIEDDESTIKEEPDCGKMIYEYMHYTGVNDNILNDFNIRVDLYTESTDSNIFDAISRSILETGNNRVLTFHSRSHTKSDSSSNVIDFINEDLFIKSFNKIRKTEFKHLKGKYKNITFKGITASTKDKLQILEDFDNTEDNEIYILASCKTIGEGVDTKNANMCVFIDPKQSYIEIIQNIGRICRKNNKTHGLATVLIPTYVDVNKYKDCKSNEEQDIIIKNELSKTGNFNGILAVISALRQEDPYMFELCLNSPTIFTEKEIKDIVKKNNNELVSKEYTYIDLFNDYKLKYNNNIDELDNFKLLSDKLGKNIKIINKKIDNKDIDIGEYDSDINFIKTENNTFMKVIGNNKLNRPNRNIKPTYHINDEIKVLWNITSEIDIDKKIFGGYINCTVKLSSEEEWIDKLEQVKDYIDKNNERPSHGSKIDNIKKLGNFIKTQLSNFKKKILIMKNEQIYNLWENFIEEYKKYFEDNTNKWMSKLDELKKYIDENNKRPPSTSKNSHVKSLAGWIHNQLTNYQNKEHIMKDKKIYNLWTLFINDDKYKKYFEDNESIWISKLNEVKLYIDENNKRPSEKTNNLGIWISSQSSTYKKKEHIMKDEKIYNLWTLFINDDKYKKYFEDNIIVWMSKLDELKKYIDKNNKRPFQSDEKILCSWLSNQLTNYQNKEHIMKDNNIYNLFDNFMNDDKYKIYFDDDYKIWLDNYNKVIKYIDENNKRPSTHDINENIKFLGNWLQNQSKNYNNKKGVMKNENIYNTYSTFINNYKQYFEDNISKWTNKFNEVIKYIDENNKLPSQKDKDDNIKVLCRWIHSQSSKYNRKIDIMNNDFIYNKWTEFINDSNYKQYFEDNITKWINNFDNVKKYIDENNKIPSTVDKNENIKILGIWLSHQQQTYKTKGKIMNDDSINNIYIKFINDDKYKQYVGDNTLKWISKLNDVKNYINENNKLPTEYSKNENIKILGIWVSHQIQNYKNRKEIMKNDKIYNMWTEFINNYKQFNKINISNYIDKELVEQSITLPENKPFKKSTTIKPKDDIKQNNIIDNKPKQLSNYQELSKKMSSQKSSTTKEMFIKEPKLWNEYHDCRDFSFKGYDNQEDIPINKIIKYLESKSKHKLKILDLGCGRNLIYQHFKDNKKMNIIGYDYVSFNDSIECDISNLPDEDDSIKICIYSQSLMGFNWKEYLNEGVRVLEYNGEIIISESIERYETIKEYLEELKMKIIIDDYIETNRWFIIHSIKQ
jgi:superfamily II DNA or RNA helicase